MKKIFLAVLLIFFIYNSFAQKGAAPTAKQIQEFDAYVEKASKDWQVPGLAIAVVKDGNVIFKKGFGVSG